MNSFGSITRLRIEFERLKSHLIKTESPIVFAHNDLLLGNVIYNKDEGTVAFIDYEYATYNYRGFDIANHFNEFVGEYVLHVMILFIGLAGQFSVCSCVPRSPIRKYQLTKFVVIPIYDGRQFRPYLSRFPGSIASYRYDRHDCQDRIDNVSFSQMYSRYLLT